MNTTAFVAVCVILTLASCTTDTPTPEAVTSSAFTPSEAFAQRLSFETVKMDQHVDPLTVVGEVSFDEDNVVRVYPIVSGSVERIFFSLGDYVKKGELLATILSTDITQYQRDLSIAKSNYEVAGKNRDRVRQLHASKFASDKELEAVENEYLNAKAEFVGKRQVLELFGGNPDAPDAVYNVYSPRSGYLVERKVNEGTQIRTDNTENMFTISDLKTVWVMANVYESDISRVTLGDSVVATAVAFPDVEFAGKVGNINRILDNESRVIKVRTEISNPDDQLLPGMFATIRIVPIARIQAIAVSQDAIFMERSEPNVIIRKTNGELEKRAVRTGKVFGQRIQVLEGLKADEQIVVHGALLVSNELNLHHQP